MIELQISNCPTGHTTIIIFYYYKKIHDEIYWRSLSKQELNDKYRDESRDIFKSNKKYF
jgi:hypothetical protein